MGRYEFIKLALGPYNKRSFLCTEGCATIFNNLKDLAQHLFDYHNEEQLKKWRINKQALHKHLYGFCELPSKINKI